MLNQAFTGENFRKIFDYENRKGVYLEGRFFPEIEELTRDIKKKTSNLRDLKKENRHDALGDYLQKKDEISSQIEALKKEKEGLLSLELEKIGEAIRSGEFKSNLIKKIINNKAVYIAKENCPITYFAIKQVQFNIRKLFKVKQANRHTIICQLRDTLNNPLPKYVVRGDFQNFYETIAPGFRKVDQWIKNKLSILISTT